MNKILQNLRMKPGSSSIGLEHGVHENSKIHEIIRGIPIPIKIRARNSAVSVGIANVQSSKLECHKRMKWAKMRNGACVHANSDPQQSPEQGIDSHRLLQRVGNLHATNAKGCKRKEPNINKKLIIRRFPTKPCLLPNGNDSRAGQQCRSRGNARQQFCKRSRALFCSYRSLCSWCGEQSRPS